MDLFFKEISDGANAVAIGSTGSIDGGDDSAITAGNCFEFLTQLSSTRVDPAIQASNTLIYRVIPVILSTHTGYVE